MRPCAQLDNVLLSGRDPQLVKLCDFGYSKDGDLESACKTTCGTPEYMAPEVRAVLYDNELVSFADTTRLSSTSSALPEHQACR